ncbi:MAG: DUF58 domain-containing protein [bacterium]|nr:DUF58 domain-containing protein [bacterium]
MPRLFGIALPGLHPAVPRPFRTRGPRRPARRPGYDGLRITKVGLWFLILLVIVLLAATNTGNNGLYLVLAMMGGTVVVSHVLAGINVRGLDVRLAEQGEIFVNRLTHLSVTIANRSRWRPRWMLVLAIDPEDIEPSLETHRRRSAPLLVPHLAPADGTRGQLEVMLRRRGRRRIRRAHVTSLFPLGLFRKGGRYPVDVELLVYPEIFQPAASQPEQTGRSGDDPTRRVGWGHDLLGLRSFRHGDDPRGIHWKKSAKTGSLIFQERQVEESRRLMIVFDNATGQLVSAGERARFERLVSEAATAAVDYLERGFEVALATRDETIPFSTGPRQRLALLEALALIEAVDESTAPLEVPDTGIAHLRLGMEREEAVA